MQWGIPVVVKGAGRLTHMIHYDSPCSPFPGETSGFVVDETSTNLALTAGSRCVMGGAEPMKLEQKSACCP